MLRSLQHPALKSVSIQTQDQDVKSEAASNELYYHHIHIPLYGTSWTHLCHLQNFHLEVM